MTEQDLVEYRKAQDLAFVVMGKRERWGRQDRSIWKAQDDPLAHHELTEWIYGFRLRAKKK